MPPPALPSVPSPLNTATIPLLSRTSPRHYHSSGTDACVIATISIRGQQAPRLLACYLPLPWLLGILQPNICPVLCFHHQ